MAAVNRQPLRTPRALEPGAPTVRFQNRISKGGEQSRSRCLITTGRDCRRGHRSKQRMVRRKETSRGGDTAPPPGIPDTRR